MNLLAPTGNGEDDNCLEILHQQSEPISRTNKLLSALQHMSLKEITFKTAFFSSRTSRKQKILLSLGHTNTTTIYQH